MDIAQVFRICSLVLTSFKFALAVFCSLNLPLMHYSFLACIAVKKAAKMQVIVLTYAATLAFFSRRKFHLQVLLRKSCIFLAFWPNFAGFQFVFEGIFSLLPKKFVNTVQTKLKNSHFCFWAFICLCISATPEISAFGVKKAAQNRFWAVFAPCKRRL